MYKETFSFSSRLEQSICFYWYLVIIFGFVLICFVLGFLAAVGFVLVFVLGIPKLLIIIKLSL